jgi:CPA2 family monovalent cation:H+ antiporter-2
MKMLDEMGELRSAPGRVAVGVLIAQDLAVVPMLILVSSLGGEEIDLADVAFKVVVAVALLAGLLWWFGRNPKLKLPFAEAIENNVDLLASDRWRCAFRRPPCRGLPGCRRSMARFLRASSSATRRFSSRVIPVIEPIQSILLVVFFLSIGLLIDLDFILANICAGACCGASGGGAEDRAQHLPAPHHRFRSEDGAARGLSMAQIGEFSFVLAAAGFASGAFGSDIYRLAIAVTAISLLVSPIWFNLMERVEEHGERGPRLLQAGAGAGL